MAAHRSFDKRRTGAPYTSRMSPTRTQPDTTAGLVARPVDRWRAQVQESFEDAVAQEIPVALRYNGAPFAVMMATPQDLDDFALGFSLSEGLIAGPQQLLSIGRRDLLEGIELDLQVAADAPVLQRERAAARALPGRSGCGVCGTRELEDLVPQRTLPHPGSVIASAALEAALTALAGHQPLNRASGGVHAAAWCMPDGFLQQVREDVGRHNALDKLIGALARDRVCTSNGFALITSRASYEMVTKAASAGMPLLVAMSAPTALAIELARSSGITLVAFARPGSHNVYTHPWRLMEAAA